MGAAIILIGAVLPVATLPLWQHRKAWLARNFASDRLQRPRVRIARETGSTLLVLSRYHRWLYRGGHPNTLARILNRISARVHALGIAPNNFVTLEVRGHRTGRAISFPLAMALVDGERYLVSMLGPEASWVRNLQAADGRALLRHGRTERVRLEEVPVEERARVLKVYLHPWKGNSRKFAFRIVHTIHRLKALRLAP